MTNEQSGALVLRDQAGTYFLVSQETLEQGRVPEEHKTALDHAIAAAQGSADGDTDGFFFPLLPIFVNPVTVAGGVAGYFGTKAAIEGSGGGIPAAELQAVLNAIKAGQPKGGR